MEGTAADSRCATCGRQMPEPPLCYGAEAPWRLLGAQEAELKSRVELTADQCVVDEKHFFVCGHIIIPVHGQVETFAWSVWCSLSERSFLHMTERWHNPDRVRDEPYFGWLSSKLPCYPDTANLKTHVQSREVGVVPAIELEPTDHPLAVEQRQGISLERVREFAHELLHE